MKFQSTHSRRVRPAKSMSFTEIECFNPRTHEECDYLPSDDRLHTPVSIHALTKSATYTFVAKCGYSSKFQSTHSRRVRLIRTNLNETFLTVSIHALTKSATKLLLAKEMVESFNPRTHEECDTSSCGCLWKPGLRFNPRTHEECD